MGADEGQRVDWLDGLRALLAWWVVFGHLAQAFDWKAGVINLNHHAVDVFIMLSGFVIAWLLARKREAYAVFITRRAFRLFPLYLPALLCGTLLTAFNPGVLSTLPETPATDIWKALDIVGREDLLPHFLVHLPLFQGLAPDFWLPNASYTILGPAWSVSLEWQFYLVAPTLLWLINRRLDWVVALLVIGGEALSSQFGTAFLGAHLAKFLIGIYTFQAVFQKRRIAIMFASLAAGWLLFQLATLVIIPLEIWLLVTAMMASRPDSALRSFCRPLRSRWLMLAGKCSYSTYLLHMLILHFGLILFGSFRHNEMLVTGFTVIGTIVLSLASYRYIEAPGIRLGQAAARRWGAKHAPEPAPAPSIAAE